MKIFINWLAFIGGMLETSAESFKAMIPRYESLKAANTRNEIAKKSEV